MSHEELLIKAKAAHQKKDFKEAAKYFEAVLEKEPKHAEAVNFLAFIYMQQGRLDEAERMLKEAMKHWPQAAELCNNLGCVCHYQKDYETSEKCYQRAINLKPEYAEAYNNYGLLCHELKRFSDAEFKFITALQFKPDYIEAMYNLCLTLKENNKLDECIAGLIAILRSEPHHAQTHFMLGKILVEKAMYTDSDKHFQLLVTQNPDSERILENIVLFLLRKERYIQVKPYCEKLVAKQPNNFEMFYNLGVIHTYLKEKADAIHYYQKVLKINPTYFPALNNLAALYLSQNNYESARFYFELALKQQPDSSNIQYIVGALSGKQTFDQAPKEYMRDLFDDYADRYESHLNQNLSYEAPRNLKQCIIKATKIKKPNWQILDLGCGTGLCGEYFKSWAKKLVGIDLSSKMINVAKQKNCYHQLIVEDNLQYLSDHLESFDLIIAADVLVYQGDLSEIFKASFKTLIPYGIFAFTTEIFDGMDYVLQQTGRFAHAKDYVLHLAKQQGFKILFFEVQRLRRQAGVAVFGNFFVFQKV